MNKKELILRLIRSLSLTIVFGYIIMTIFGPIVPPDYQASNLILDTEEWISFITAALFFFVIVLIPLPKTKENQFVIVRSVFITALISFLVFVGARLDEGTHPIIILIIIVPLLLVGLILFSWKNKIAN